MEKILIDNSIKGTTSIAIINEDSQKIVRFFREYTDKQSMYGNIYLGQICQISKPLNGVFIDFGEEKNGLMRLGDLKSACFISSKSNDNSSKDHINDKILVQVLKEPRESKGAFLSSNISIPGRYCILMPQNNPLFGISKKIKSASERKRIKEHVQSEMSNHAVIIRTTSMGIDKNDILSDYRKTVKIWDKIQSVAKSTKECGLVYQESAIIKSCIRDYCNSKTSDIQISSNTEDFIRIKNEIKDFTNTNITHIDENTNIFKSYNLLEQINSFFQNEIITQSGIKIIIQQTPACVTFDINSYKSNNQSIMNINLEAAAEIGRHIICRNLSGIIIIDFIDVESSSDKQIIKKELENAMAYDDRNNEIYYMSELNLICMSRERIGNSLIELTTNLCEICHGTGVKESSLSKTINLLDQIMQTCKDLSQSNSSIEIAKNIDTNKSNVEKNKTEFNQTNENPSSAQKHEKSKTQGNLLNNVEKKYNLINANSTLYTQNKMSEISINQTTTYTNHDRFLPSDLSTLSILVNSHIETIKILENQFNLKIKISFDNMCGIVISKASNPHQNILCKNKKKNSAVLGIIQKIFKTNKL